MDAEYRNVHVGTAKIFAATTDYWRQREENNSFQPSETELLASLRFRHHAWCHPNDTDANVLKRARGLFVGPDRTAVKMSYEYHQITVTHLILWIRASGAFHDNDDAISELPSSIHHHYEMLKKTSTRSKSAPAGSCESAAIFVFFFWLLLFNVLVIGLM